MPRRFQLVLPVALIALGSLALRGLDDAENEQPAGPRWYKGNTHTHTLNSDGDTHPDDVARWYKGHSYQFVVLTDHNVLTSVEALNALHGLDNRFLVVRGEEVTDRFGDKPLHINALNPSRLVTPQGGTSAVDVVQRNVNAIRAASGVPHINHPSFGWSLTADDIAAVRNNRLFEIFNGHPLVNNEGGGGVPSLEQAWDMILSRGILLYGLAVDDAHHFTRPEDPTAARPGQGWIYVRADTLTPAALLTAMDRGDFYSSTGVELQDVTRSADALTVTVRATNYSKYRIQFMGRGGKVLQESVEPTATYRIKGDEGYVRATIYESNGQRAWTQPVMLNGAR